MTAKVLGPYRAVSELGRGGMGVVYKGYEPALRRFVAIKVLGEMHVSDAAVKERFLREAQSTAGLSNPHIMAIHAIGDEGRQPYFVMEYVDGETVGDVIRRLGVLSPGDAAKIVYQAAVGLHAAHSHGVVHRDIKPSNLMLSQQGLLKIADFGIARSMREINSRLTLTGEFVGTPGYLSPEICQGRPVDARSDIFSLGMVFFEALTGRVPFHDESPLALLLSVVQAQIPDVREINADVDPELARILTRMVAKSPEDRYPTSQALADDLARHPLVADGTPLSFKVLSGRQGAPILEGNTPPAFTYSARPTVVSGHRGRRRWGWREEKDARRATPVGWKKAIKILAALASLAVAVTMAMRHQAAINGWIFSHGPAATTEAISTLSELQSK